MKEPGHEKDLENFDVFDSGFLACLKRDFISEFGPNERFTIAMFSHFLPCTQQKHMCAKLIGKIADLTSVNFIVSYDMPYMTTDEHAAIDAMGCDSVTLIHPKECNYFLSMSDLQPVNRGVWMRPPNNYRHDIITPANTSGTVHGNFHRVMGHNGLPIFLST